MWRTSVKLNIFQFSFERRRPTAAAGASAAKMGKSSGRTAVEKSVDQSPGCGSCNAVAVRLKLVRASAGLRRGRCRLITVASAMKPSAYIVRSVDVASITNRRRLNDDEDRKHAPRVQLGRE